MPKSATALLPSRPNSVAHYQHATLRGLEPPASAVTGRRSLQTDLQSLAPKPSRPLAHNAIPIIERRAAAALAIFGCWQQESNLHSKPRRRSRPFSCTGGKNRTLTSRFWRPLGAQRSPAASGRQDSNLRLPEPKSGGLTKLSYTPENFPGVDALLRPGVISTPGSRSWSAAEHRAHLSSPARRTLPGIRTQTLVVSKAMASTVGLEVRTRSEI